MTTETKDKQRVITVRLTETDHARALAAAKAQGLSLNLFCVAAISSFTNDTLDVGAEEAGA
jgi:predicted HicB family RNase H-like nuclease